MAKTELLVVFISNNSSVILFPYTKILFTFIKHLVFRASDKKSIQVSVILFYFIFFFFNFFVHENLFCGYLFKATRRDASNEYHNIS